MKKLLLLALTIGSATALTACGGSEKAVDSFLENHTNFLEGSEVVNNYTVKTGSTTFKVDGNVLNTGNDFYEINEDLTASYWSTYNYYSNVPTGEESYYTTDLISNQYYIENLSVAELKADTDAYNAFVGPFAQLAAAQSTVLDGKELSSKFFSVEEDEEGNETLFFVVDKKETTAANSPMTIEFTYNLNAKEKTTDEFATATVKMGSTTWVYSNLSNEDYEFGATAHNLTTPGETIIENVIARASVQNDMTLTTKLPNDEGTANVDVTVEINDGTYKFTSSSSAFTNLYVSTESDGYTVYTKDGNFWKQSSAATLADVPALEALLETLDHDALDAGLLTDFSTYQGTNYTSEYSIANVDFTKLAVGDVYANIEYVDWANYGETTVNVRTRAENDDTTGGYRYYSEYSITSFNTYATVEVEDGEDYVADLAFQISELAVISEDFYTLVDMINNVDDSYTVADHNHIATSTSDATKSLTVDGYNNYVLNNGTKSFAFNNLDTTNGSGTGENYTRYSVDTTDGNEGNWVAANNGDNTQMSGLVGSGYLFSGMQNYFDGEVTAATFTSYDAETKTFSKTSSPSLSITLGDTLAECVITYQTYVFSGFGTVDLDTEAANVIAGGAATASTAAEVTAILATFDSSLTGNQNSNSAVGTVDLVMFATMDIVWTTSDETVCAIADTGKGSIQTVAEDTEFTLTATVTLNDGTTVTRDYTMTNTKTA